jgi:hypothetical protein
LEREEAATVKQAYQKAEKVSSLISMISKMPQKNLDNEIPNASVIRNPVNLKDQSLVPLPREKSIQMAMVGNLLTAHKGQDISLNILKNRVWRKGTGI